MPVTRQRHESAADAFAALKPGRRVRKRHVHKKVLAAAKAFALDVDGRMGAECLINRVFKNNSSVLGTLLNKSIKVVEEDDTGDVCVFSDVYDVSETELDKIVERCTATGTPVTAFVHDYPELQFSQGHYPDRRTMLNEGYAQLYRGCLAGLRFSGGTPP